MLQHQMQPTFNTCMATCVAMVAGQPVDEVVERWHQKFHDKTDWLDDALDYYKIPYFYGSQRKADAAVFESKQVQSVAGYISPFNPEMDTLAVADRFGNGLYGGAAFAEGFDNGETAGVFDDRVGHILICLGLDRSMNTAVMGDDQQKAEGEGGRGQGNQSRQGTA